MGSIRRCPVAIGQLDPVSDRLDRDRKCPTMGSWQPRRSRLQKIELSAPDRAGTESEHTARTGCHGRFNALKAWIDFSGAKTVPLSRA